MLVGFCFVIFFAKYSKCRSIFKHRSNFYKLVCVLLNSTALITKSSRPTCKEMMTQNRALQSTVSPWTSGSTIPGTSASQELVRNESSEIREHVGKACKYREATRNHSKSQVPMITMQKHEDNDCPCVVVSCPPKCSVQTLLRSELSAHLSERQRPQHL